MVKEVFGQLKKKQFNTIMNNLMHLFLLLTELSKASLGYAIIVNILCTFFC